jgi:hypothetical protein
MNASSKRVFYYQADANPIGGYLTHPFESVLKTQTSASLGQAGGHIAARAESFHLDDLIRTGAHYSQTTGSVQKTTGNWTTLVTSVVEDLNVFEVVTADRIVSRLALEHSSAVGQYYPKVTFVGCQYENLRIDGLSVTPAVDLELLSDPGSSVRSAKEGDILSEAAPKLEFPARPWPQVPSFLNRAIAQSNQILKTEGVPDWLKSRFDWISSDTERAKRGYVLASLVNGVHDAAPGSSFGHVVHVPGFGNIFLGELIVTPVGFDLTMLRIEMGCLAEGNISFASGRGTGFPMP